MIKCIIQQKMVPLYTIISRWSSFQNHPWYPQVPEACASDIALQTVGVTAVNCFAGGRFVFIGRDDDTNGALEI